MEVNQCQVCLNYFIDPTSLQNHIETHTKRELYQCIVILKSALSQVHSASQQVLNNHHTHHDQTVSTSGEAVVHNGLLETRQNKTNVIAEAPGVVLQRNESHVVTTQGETIPLPHYNGEISVIQSHKDRHNQSIIPEQVQSVENYVINEANKLNQIGHAAGIETENVVTKPDTTRAVLQISNSDSNEGLTITITENVDMEEVYDSHQITPADITRSQIQVHGDGNEAIYSEQQDEQPHAEPGSDPEASKHGKGSKNLQCEICQKTFTTSFATRRHKMSHSNERPNTCNVCGKGFIGKQNLEVHYRVHTGEKPYECEVCGKKFTQHGSLYKHRERHQVPQEQTPNSQLQPAAEVSPGNKDVGHNYEALRLLEDTVDHRDNLDGLRLLEQIASEKEKIALTPSAEVIAGEYEGDLHEEEVLEDGVVDHSAMNIIVPEQGMLMFSNYQQEEGKKDQYDVHDQDKNSAATQNFEQGTQLLHGNIQEHHQTVQYETHEDASFTQNKENEGNYNSESTNIGEISHTSEQTTAEVRQVPPDGAETEQFSHENKEQETTDLNANAEVSENPPQSEESPGLQCKFCLIFCPTIFELQSHCSNYHSGPKPYRCNVCGRRFSASFCLRRHIMLHTGEKPFSCSYCGKGFIEKQHLQSHVRTHTGEKPYKCKVCDKSFTQYGTLHNHMQTHNKTESGTPNVKKKGVKKEKKVENPNSPGHAAVPNDRPPENSQIPVNTSTPLLMHDPIAQFSQALSLQMQMYTNAKHLYANADVSNPKNKKDGGTNEEKPHKRSRRSSQGRSPSRTYEQPGHSLEYQNSTTPVEKTSPHSIMDIKKEMATDLSNNSGYQADVKSPTYSRDLQTIADLSVLPNKELEAMAALTGKRQQCQYCELQFNSPITLERHLRTHRGQKPFACNFCQKSFSTSYCLRRHVMTHTGERPHGCHFCGKRFIEKQHLLIHTRVHTGEKPYQCKFCLKRFPQGGSLYRHVQIHTKGLKGFSQNDQAILDQIKMESTEANLPQNYTVSQSPMQPGLDVTSESHTSNKDEVSPKSEELKKRAANSQEAGQVETQRRDSLAWSGTVDNTKSQTDKSSSEELTVKASEPGSVEVLTGEHLLLSPLSKELLTNQYYQHVKVKAESGYEDQDLARRASFEKTKQDSYDIISDIVRRDYLQQQFNYLLKNMDPYAQSAAVLNRQIMTSVAAAGVGTSLANHKDGGHQVVPSSSDEPINLTDNKVTGTTTTVCTDTVTTQAETLHHENPQNMYVNQANQEPVSCSVCGEKFVTLSILHQHMSLAHSETTEHRCEICGEIFTMKEHLIIHYQMHTGDNSYLLQQFNTLRSGDTAMYQAYYNRLQTAKASENPESNPVHEQPLDGTSTGDMKSHPRTSVEEERYVTHPPQTNTQISVISRQSSSQGIYADTSSSVGLEMTPTHGTVLNTSTESAKLTETSDNLSTDSEAESDMDGQVSRQQTVSSNIGQAHSVTSSITQQHSLPTCLDQQTLHSLHSSPTITSTSSHYNSLAQNQSYVPSASSVDTDKLTGENMPQFIQTGNILSSFSELASQVMRRNVMPTMLTQVPSATPPAVPRQLPPVSPRQPSQVEINSQISENSKVATEGENAQPASVVDSKEKLGFKTFECEICRKQFLNKRSYYRHIRLHTGEQLCKCEICGKGFTGVFGLRRHMITHSGHKPHKCDFCGKGFIEKQHLECHRRIHTGEKPFKCEVCDKRFTQYGTLHRHKRIHTKEKPYGCPMCPKQFGENRQLTQHMKSHAVESTTNQIGEGIESTNQIEDTPLGLDLHTNSARDSERDLNLSVQAVQSITALEGSQHTS